MIRLFKHYVSYSVAVLVFLDFVLLAVAAEGAWHIRTTQIGSSLGPLPERLIELFAYAALVIATMVAVGCYSPEALRSIRFATARLLVAVSMAVIGISVLDFLIPGDLFWRSTLLYAMVLSVALLVANRVVAGPLLGTSTFKRRIVVLGSAARAVRLRDLSRRANSGFVIAGFVDMGDAPSEIPEAIPRTSIADLGRYVDRNSANEVVLALQERRNALPLKDLLNIKTRGVDVSEFGSFLERQTGRVDLDTLNPSWLIFSDGFSSAQALSSAFKRVFDVVVSALILALTLPIILFFAILVKLESGGPALYRQTRVGHYGAPFEIIKLRSMRQDAEKDGAQWAQKNDPRVTRIGRFIRLVRIDELPQLWTVLTGRMSFVGPRPERPEFVAELDRELPYYAERHVVKPGITGWAQINYPYGATREDARQKLEFDLYYAKNYSPFLDVLILLQTVRVILWPEGAR